MPGHLWISPRLACTVFFASMGVAGWSLHHAVVIEAPPPVGPMPPEVGMVAISRRPAARRAYLVAAVDKDPFHSERRRPSERFHLPGERPPVAAASTPSPGPAPPLRLIGTALMSEGRGFAMCQWSADPPRLVRIGERVGDLTLKAVEQGRAVFLNTRGERVEVRMLKVGT